MTPKEYEDYICEYFTKQGYKAETTPYSGDYGVDIFAYKDREKIAIQVKMYGGSTRKVNRQMIMELHGAKDYFDCTKAILVTNGDFMTDALEVANKLKVELLNIEAAHIDHHPITTKKEGCSSDAEYTFNSIWEKYILPLKGQTISNAKGTRTNKIIDIDWAKVTRITSTGNKGTIDIEPFKFAINTLLDKGVVTRDCINQNYTGRASSGIVLILSQVPFFKIENNPTRLILAKVRKK